MKSIISIILSAALLMGLAACGTGTAETVSADSAAGSAAADSAAADEAPDTESTPAAEESGTEEETAGPVVGGWDLNVEWEISGDVQAVFDQAVETLTGVDYTPTAYLGRQIVSGTNHCILSKAVVVRPDAEPYYVLMYIYEDLNGAVEIKNIVDLDVAGSSDSDKAVAGKQEEGLMGGWAAAEENGITDDLQAAFEKGTESLLGVSYEPAACLSTQVVSGTNYCILSKAQVVAPDTSSAWKLVYLYENLEGGAEVLNVADLEIAELSETSDTAE